VTGLFVALEGIDGAGKSTAVQLTAAALRERGVSTVALDRSDTRWASAYVASHLAGLRELIWGGPAQAPYLELGDEHWVHLQAAWYRAFAQCVVTPWRGRGNVVLADTWGYKFLAKLRLRPVGAVDFQRAWEVFTAIGQPELIVYLRADPAQAAARKPAMSGSETGQGEGGPDLSAAAFTAYQRRLAAVLDGFAGQLGWPRVDTRSRAQEDTAAAIADIIEQHLAGQASSGALAGTGGPAWHS
jgi:thymidylate kinase